MLGSSKDGTAPLPEAVNLTAGMPADVKPNPTAPCSRNRCSRLLGKPGRNAHGGEETACPWSPVQRRDIYVLGEDFAGLPLNNIGGLNLRPHAQNTGQSRFMLGISLSQKAKDYFAEDVTGVVTYRNSFYKLEPTQQLTVQDGGLQRQAAQTQPSEDKLTIASYNIENFSANNAKNETQRIKVTLIANSFIP